MKQEIIVKQNFSAAHFLKHYKGKCEKMHGHTFKMEVYIRVIHLNESGISYDFTEVKEFLKALVPDHKVLNDLFEFSPSAENLAQYYFHQIKKKYPVTRVIIWESDDAGAVYAGSV